MEHGVRPVIKALDEKGFDRFFEYLTHHLSENGIDGPMFQPLSGDDDPFPANKMASFISGLSVPLGTPGWRRAWIAEGATGEVIGHVDLRARPEPYTGHRALLGMGVSSSCRRAGLGKSLVEFVLSWARGSNIIESIDLAVLSGNLPAVSLYEKLGFTRVCEIPDMFKINDVLHGDIHMTKSLRGA
jgi:ribosomal protein S18 acetylase RimI-like enzyme